MAKGTFWQRGEALDYTNGSGATIEANTVVVYGDRIGIIGCDIAPGETGSLHVAGVFEMPKHDQTAINAGVAVYWDDTNGGITTTSSGNTPAGYAAQAAAADDTAILVNLNA